MGNLLVVLIIAAAVLLAVRKIIKDRRFGKSCCQDGCSSCGGCCHGKAVKNELSGFDTH